MIESLQLYHVYESMNTFSCIWIGCGTRDFKGFVFLKPTSRMFNFLASEISTLMNWSTSSFTFLVAPRQGELTQAGTCTEDAVRSRRFIADMQMEMHVVCDSSFFAAQVVDFVFGPESPWKNPDLWLSMLRLTQSFYIACFCMALAEGCEGW